MHFSSGLSFSHHQEVHFTPTLGVGNLIFLTGEVFLIIGFTLVVIFNFSTPLGVLIRLFFIRLVMAYIFRLKRTWISLLFVIVYIGGVLVLAIYATLRSTNWRLPPTAVLLFILVLSLQGDISHSFYSGNSLGDSLRMILALLVLLLYSLFLIIKLIK